MTVRSIITVFN